MATAVAVVQTVSITDTGVQEITKTGWGQTPKAALFFISGATADDTPVDHARICIGITDGSRERAVAVAAEHGVATTNTYRQNFTDECLVVKAASDGSIDGEASGVGDGVGANPGPIANGWRVNWGNAPAAAYKITAVFFAGADLSVYAGHTDGPGTITPPDNSVNVTDPGFEPDVVLAFCNWRDGTSSWSQCSLSVGVADNGVAVTQKSMNFFSANGAGAADLVAEVCSDYIVQQAYSAGMYDTCVKLEDFDADGFTATWERNGDADDSDLNYLALKFGGGEDHWVGVIDTKTSTGTQAYTAPGFTPQALILLGSFLSSVDSHATDGDAGTFGLGACTSSDEASNSIQDEDAEATTDTQCMADAIAMNLPQDDGSAGLEASLSSFDANGFTLDYAAADGTARKWVGLAIEASGAPPSVKPYWYYQRNKMRRAC